MWSISKREDGVEIADRKSLAEKLGLKAGMRTHVSNPPPEYRALLGPAVEDILFGGTFDSPLDFAHYFFMSRDELERAFPMLKGALAPDGMLWVSWPKLSSGVASDLDENSVREIGLRHGLVDVKVVSVDSTWSALKFVFRKKDRRAI